jgi:preprotein translocase subunit SecG
MLVALHLTVSVILILVVLLQTGKGADLAGAFGGGGSQTAFGSRGAATFLSKLTTGAAVVFMLTSFSLAILSARGSASVLDEADLPAPTAPAPAPEPSPEAGGTGAALPGSDESAGAGASDGAPLPADDGTGAAGEESGSETAPDSSDEPPSE